MGAIALFIWIMHFFKGAYMVASFFMVRKVNISVINGL